MKHLTFLFAALFIVPVMMHAQGSEKIQQAYTQAEIEAIFAQDPNELAFLEFAADRMTNRQTMRGDISTMPDISELNSLRKNSAIPELNATNFNLLEFNPLAYDINLDNEVHYYRIGDSDQVIQILSFQRVRHLFDSGQ